MPLFCSLVIRSRYANARNRNITGLGRWWKAAAFSHCFSGHWIEGIGGHPRLGGRFAILKTPSDSKRASHTFWPFITSRSASASIFNRAVGVYGNVGCGFFARIRAGTKAMATTGGPCTFREQRFRGGVIQAKVQIASPLKVEAKKKFTNTSLVAPKGRLSFPCPDKTRFCWDGLGGTQVRNSMRWPVRQRLVFRAAGSGKDNRRA